MTGGAQDMTGRRYNDQQQRSAGIIPTIERTDGVDACERQSLLAYMMRRIRDGVARRLGPIGEALANIVGTTAKITLTDVLAGCVEIVARLGAMVIAGSKNQGQGQQAQGG
jgi:hypothetical protein